MAGLLYELGKGFQEVSDEQIFGIKSKDCAVRFLRWMGEDRRG
jgi:hypothetical protein